MVSEVITLADRLPDSSSCSKRLLTLLRIFEPEDGRRLPAVDVQHARTTMQGDQKLLAEAHSVLATVEQDLAPAGESALIPRITGLLAHYWQQDADSRVKQMVLLDWAEGLSDFPQTVVHEACRTWLRRETKRPSIADIRQICHDQTRTTRRLRDRLRQVLEE